mmetsp:Transcript_442/g.1519  ORF Transcript_442/g.1519 Transcript_442/m.1519 type:complete len:151 (+) Transcript_442:99-551(+)
MRDLGAAGLRLVYKMRILFPSLNKGHNCKIFLKRMSSRVNLRALRQLMQPGSSSSSQSDRCHGQQSLSFRTGGKIDAERRITRKAKEAQSECALQVYTGRSRTCETGVVLEQHWAALNRFFVPIAGAGARSAVSSQQLRELCISFEVHTC